MRPGDIEKLVSVGRPSVSRDGSFAVFATSRPSIEANRPVGQLWRVDLPDGEPRRITRGIADGAPQLSPDDTRIAFLRGDAKGKPQVHVVSASGGEPVQATDAPIGVDAFDWSPDGTQLAFLARVPEAGRYGTVDKLDASAEAPRRIDGIRWNANGLGYLADRPAQLFTVPAPAVDAEPFYEPAASLLTEGSDALQRPLVPAMAVQLTDGTASRAGVVYTADGTEILTVLDEIEPDVRDLRARLVAVRADGSGERNVLDKDARLSLLDVAVAGDGTVAVLGFDVGPTGVDFIAPGVALWILGDDGPLRITDPEVTDLGEMGSHITVAGDDFLVQNRSRGRVELLRVSRAGEGSLLRGGVEATGHDASADGRRIVLAIADPKRFGELEVIDVLEDGSLSSVGLTDFGAPLAPHIVLPAEVEIVGRDGYPVHGWVAKPAGAGPFPVILQVHGGPFAQYGVHVFDETQVLVEAGYAVVYCNPRGSAGYGRDHGRSIRQRMGTLDFADVIDFFEAAVASDAALDGTRAGVMGGSYGGYLTAWVIAHDHRFAGAIVERGFLDPVSFSGTSDIGSFFGDEYVGTDPAVVEAQSPMAYVGQVTTPTLVIHSELDFRCPLEQATRYYSALKRGGVEAELLIFPGENHELTRSGSPRHRVERFDAVLEWWRRHLPIHV